MNVKSTQIGGDHQITSVAGFSSQAVSQSLLGAMVQSGYDWYGMGEVITLDWISEQSNKGEGVVVRFGGERPC